MAGISSQTTANVTNHDVIAGYEPYEFLQVQPALSAILIIILIIASIAGSCGNILILVSVATQRDLQSMESVFVVNLACSDLYVTLIADPLSIVGKTVGWRFFDSVPALCRIVASLCTISCVGSLMTLSAMSCNRYVLICHQHLYHKLFTVKKSILMCCSFYLVGFLLVFLNVLGIGDHSFDHKSLECIWDRMANHNYTIVFAVVMVFIPISVTGAAYLRLYLHVKKVRMKVHAHARNSFHVQSAAKSDDRSLQPAAKGSSADGGMAAGRGEPAEDGMRLQVVRYDGTSAGKTDKTGEGGLRLVSVDADTGFDGGKCDGGNAMSAECQRDTSPAAGSEERRNGSTEERIPHNENSIRKILNTDQKTGLTTNNEQQLYTANLNRNESPKAGMKFLDINGKNKDKTSLSKPNGISQHNSTPDRHPGGKPKGEELHSPQQSNSTAPGTGVNRSTLRLARTLFIIYLVFTACWLPFSLLIVLDAQDTFSHELHVTIVAWAHLHPSINWLVYYHTNTKFRAAFRRLLRIDQCC